MLNKRQRKKYEKKLLNIAFKALVEFEPEADKPCDDLKCESCYVQSGDIFS